MNLPLKVEYTRPLISIQDMVNFIDKGDKYIKDSYDKLSQLNELDFFQGIILSPDYQREYRSKSKEESSIIESIILGIPIPEIFLVRTENNGIQLRHVMDGQHRLTAIHRFVKDKFALTGLELLKEDEKYKNKKFSQLEKSIKYKILGSHLSVLEFEAFEDNNLEIELFKRYNSNTKPLEKHEMSMATFYSPISLFITNFLNVNMERAKSGEVEEKLMKIYNITNNRKNKQKNHQEICVILSILSEGPNLNYKDGVEIAYRYLESNSKNYKNDKNYDISKVRMIFDEFNEFMLKLSENIEYPFSTAIFKGEDNRTNKFHTGVSMVLALIFYFFKINLNDDNLLEDIKTIIKNSPLGDETYKASSTNVSNLMKYLYHRNNVFEKEFSSLEFKKNIPEIIKRRF